jgi:hypothetical protein
MVNPTRPAVIELNRLVIEGISTDIYLALEAHGIFRTIGERIPAANASTYQPMLVALQAYASAEFVLAVTRLLERQRSYELHSVHGVLTFLRDNAQDIPVQQPIFIEQSMQRLGVWDSIPAEAGIEQTCAVVEALVLMLPHYAESASLNALKSLRDKRIAHPERSKPTGLPTTSWEEALKLLEVPREALAVCGAYTNVAYVDSTGRLMTDGDAARAGAATRRILELSVLPSSPAR